MPHLLQAGQLVCHGLEAAHKEVADRDVGALRTVEHLLEPIYERRVGGRVEDVHSASKMAQWFASPSVESLIVVVIYVLDAGHVGCVQQHAASAGFTETQLFGCINVAGRIKHRITKSQILSICGVWQNRI